MQLFTTPNIDFIGKKKITLYLVIGTIMLLIFSVFFHKGIKLGIDFKGGTLMQFHFDKDVDVGIVRSALSDIGFGDSEIKHFGASNEVIVWMQLQPNPKAVSDTLSQALKTSIPDVPFEVVRIEAVGPKIGKELVTGAFWAVILSSLLIIVYLTWRFEFRFAVTALICALYDVIFIIMIFSFFNIELSLATIAAILTILGYSLNDTIVILDRIRENLRSLKKDPFPMVVNRSLNETLSRTLITALTVFFTVLVLYIFGGEVIHDFSFALLVGVIEGSYSTLFIAAPFLVALTERAEKRKLARLK